MATRKGHTCVTLVVTDAVVHDIALGMAGGSRPASANEVSGPRKLRDNSSGDHGCWVSWLNLSAGSLLFLFIKLVARAIPRPVSALRRALPRVNFF